MDFLSKLKSTTGIDSNAAVQNPFEQKTITDAQSALELKALFSLAEPKKEDADGKKGYDVNCNFNIASQYAEKAAPSSGKRLNFES